jgi:hypothetical protein
MAATACRFRSHRAEEQPMEQKTLPNIYKYKLKATPQQEQAMMLVVRRCRELYNAAL